MKCIKCLKETKGSDLYLGDNEFVENIIKNWNICSECEDDVKSNKAHKAHKYYTSNKSHYIKLHKQYKKELTDSYVANCIADRSIIRAKEVPKVMKNAKRQVIKLNRIIKEK